MNIPVWNTVASAIHRIGLAVIVAGAAGCGDANPQAPSRVAAEAPPAEAGVDSAAPAAGDFPAGDFPAGEALPGLAAASPAAGADAGRGGADDATLKASAPVVVSPKDRTEIEGLTVTVVIENATGTFVSETPFDYRFELYEGEAGPGAPVQEASAGQGTGTTRHTFARELRQGTTHRWRARAELGGVGGPWSDWAVFRTPILKVLHPPDLAHPINGETVENLREPLYVTNGVAVNAAGQVVYEFEVDDDLAFGSPVRTEARRTGGPAAGGRTVGYLDQDLVAGTSYHWRVRARDDVDRSPWSDVQTFDIAPEEPPPTGGDEINASTVTYLHRNIADWPITSRVTGLTIRGNGICVYHTGAGSFPVSKLGDPGEQIDIEGNVWVFAQFGTRWYGATWDWMRPGQQCKSENTSSLGPDQIRKPPMDHTWQPQSGDTLCFAVSARARDNVEAGRERTNIKCAVVP